MSEPLLVVVGATGTQGGSVIRTFLSSSQWRIRGLTRNPSSASAQALAAQGVEMVQADVDKPSTLPAAFAGATAIFAVTDFWGPFRALAIDPDRQKQVLKHNQTINHWSYEKEAAQAKGIMDAAAKVNVLERFIWSGLSAPKKISGGKYTWVYHFDSKAEATEYLRETYPELWKRTSVIQVGFYAENHSTHPFMRPEKVASSLISGPSGLKWKLFVIDQD